MLSNEGFSKSRADAPAVAGFSLVEVCLAILVVAIGLLAVFGLFPMGLRASEDASASTRTALFAQTIFNGIRANSTIITNFSDWNTANLTANVASNLVADGTLQPPLAFPTVSGSQEVQTYVRYVLTMNTETNGFAPTLVRLDVSAGGSGPFVHEVFYTELYYQGMGTQ